MTPRQFFARHKAQVERDIQTTELARIVAFLVAGSSGNLKKGLAIKKFWPLPWDETARPVFEKQSDAERLAFEAKAKAIFKQNRASGSD